MISGKTRVFAILGAPVAHSLSPAMQNAAFRALGLDAVYVPLLTRPDDVASLMRALARAGGGGNVTVPHKEAAAAAVDRPADRVRALGVCNTFWGDDGAVHGDNTDVDGVLAALARLDAPSGGWLVIGTGGGARAVVAAAKERGASVAVRSRDNGRARAFGEWAAGLGVAATDPAMCEVVINTTPLGLKPNDAHPLPAAELGRIAVALDMVYAAGATPWVRGLRARGIRAADGREVLLAQGAAAFTRWFPRVRPPIEIMRAALNAGLR